MDVDSPDAEVEVWDAEADATQAQCEDTADAVSVDVNSASTGDVATEAEGPGGTKMLTMKKSIRAKTMTETERQDPRPARETSCKRANGRFEVFYNVRQF